MPPLKSILETTPEYRPTHLIISCHKPDYSRFGSRTLLLLSFIAPTAPPDRLTIPEYEPARLFLSYHKTRIRLGSDPDL